MDPMEKLTAARASLVLQAPFYAALALRLKFKEAPPGLLGEGEAAGTNGVHIFYNPAALEPLTHGETVGLLAHEASHPALKHHLRRGDREARLWNIAADHAIDPALITAGFELPGGGHTRPDLEGKSVEDIYQILLDERDAGGDPGENEPNPTGSVMDWPGPSDGGTPGDGSEGDGDGKPDPDTPGDMPGGGKPDPGADPSSPPSPADIEAEAKKWETAAAAAMLQAAGAGMLPGGTLEMVQDAISPRVPWQDILAPFLTRTAEDYSWNPPDRRFIGKGLYLPSLQSEGLARVVLAVDTSGSMPPALVSEILQETAEILEFWPGAELTVIYHHSQVYRMETYSAGDPPALAEYESGGTDFRPVFDYVDQEGINPDCLVLLTDLDGPAPDDPPDYPVLWISYGRETAPWGEVVKV